MTDTSKTSTKSRIGELIESRIHHRIRIHFLTVAERLGLGLFACALSLILRHQSGWLWTAVANCLVIVVYFVVIAVIASFFSRCDCEGIAITNSELWRYLRIPAAGLAMIVILTTISQFGLLKSALCLTILLIQMFLGCFLMACSRLMR